MDPSRFDRAKRLFAKAASIAPRDRKKYLADSCPDDPEVRALVVRLLERSTGDGLLRAIERAVSAATSPAQERPLATGARMGTYEILEMVGAGSMGRVYRARDTVLGRQVALKTLPRHSQARPDRIARFEREARLLASLNHINIATLHGFEQIDGVLVLVMEHVNGETLEDRIARGPLSAVEAVRCFTQIAEALEAAHRNGIVHRDLKPANIMIATGGTVKVLDFGLAKTLDQRSAGSDATPSRQTSDGIILGTAGYMSPEQARGESMDERTDIWAFGCCLFEALTGRPAFSARTLADTMAAVLDAEPDWQCVPSRTPLGLRVLLRRCLRKNPHQRLHNIADARIELEEALASTPPHPVLSHELVRGVRAAVGLAAALALAAALGFGLWSIMRPERRRSPQIVRTAIPLPPGTSLARDFRRPTVAISPDGTHIAFVAESGGTTHLYLRALEDLTSRRVDGSEGARMPFFSHDSRSLGFLSRNELVRMPLSGGSRKTITQVFEQARGASWGPNQEIVLANFHNVGLSHVSADGGEAEPLTELDGDEWSHRLPEVLPGGDALLFRPWAFGRRSVRGSVHRRVVARDPCASCAPGRRYEPPLQPIGPSRVWPRWEALRRPLRPRNARGAWRAGARAR